MYKFLPSQQRIWIISLALLWGLFLFGGFLLGTPDAAYSHRMPTWTRMASSFSLVIVALSWFLFSRGKCVNRYALFISIGMAFGFLGDLILAGVIPVPDRVIMGIGSFAIGHIFYIVAILRLSNQFGLNEMAPRWGMLILWWLIGFAGWYFVVFQGQDPMIVHWVALPYALLLASTAGLGSGLAMQDRHFIPLALGGALFLLSDLILAADMFNDLYFPLIGDVVWLTYGPAQMLIAYSIGTAWKRFCEIG